MKKRSTHFLLFFLLLIGQRLAANPPVWTVNSNNFQFSMNLTAQVKVGTLADNAAGNLVGVFVGNELRGAATPIVSGGVARYFVTIFSTASAGENLTFKVYTASGDQIHPAGESLVFQRQSVVGNAASPFALTYYADDDFPISLAAIPAQAVAAGTPFLNTYLPDYLQTVDNQPVTWTVTGTPNLIAQIVSGNTLKVVATSANWAGTNSVTVKATETGTAHAYSASRTVSFTKNAAVGVPLFSAVPPQKACEEIPFPSGNLNNYLTFPGGGCLGFSFKIIPPTGTEAVPTWSQPSSPPGSMTLKVRARYGGRDFPGNSLKLAAFRGGVLAGVATPVLAGTDKLFFLTVGKVGTGNVTFKFYDGGKQYLHQNLASLPFVPNGNADLDLEFSPLNLTVPANAGIWTAALTDQNWYGTAQVVFYARSCADPSKVDSAQTGFSRQHAVDCQQFDYYRDSDNDGFGNLAVHVQNYTAPSGYVLDHTDCDDTRTSVHPGATEICNFLDDNCIGGVDEGKVQVNFSGTVVNTGCPGVSSGKVNLSITAGKIPLAYVWASGQATQNIANLGVGNYQVTVAGSDGCTSTKVFAVAAMNSLAVVFSAVNVTCFASENGTVFSTPAGGTAPYTYLWSNAKTTKNINLLPAGTYLLTLTDAVGCTKTGSQAVTEPTAVNFTLASVPAGTKHKVTLTPSGGIAPYTYNVSGTTVYQTSNIFPALAAATYIFKTKDVNGCIKSRAAKVPITTPGPGNKPGTGAGNAFEWELGDREAELPEEVLLKMFEARASGSEMLAFPNPFSGRLSIAFPEIVEAEGSVLIVDALGRTVFQKNVAVEKESLLELDTAGLPPGTYLVSFLGKSGEIKKTRAVKL